MNENPPISRHIVSPDLRRLPTITTKLASLLSEWNVEGHLVGGAVRDALMGKDAEDLDITVHADAGQVGQMIAAALGGYLAHLNDDLHVARVALDDSDWSGYIDVATMRGGSIESDLHKRDFSINAMAIPLESMSARASAYQVVDPFGGQRDLDDGVLRMVSPAALDEDPVRMMRGARLAAQSGFSVEPDTAVAIRARAPAICDAPPERVRDELMRLLQASNACYGVRLLDDLGLLCAIIPELEEAKGVTQPREHYWDVFNHLVETVGWVDAIFDAEIRDESPLNNLPRFEGMSEYFNGHVSDGFDRQIFLKLTALLHDISKPATKSVEESGRIRFFGHHTEGAEVCRGILNRLRFSSKATGHVSEMVRQHLRPRQMSEKGMMPSRRALYRYYRNVGDVAVDTLYLNTADYLAARGPMLEADDWREHCLLVRHILDQGGAPSGEESGDSLKTLPKLVGGYDIMDRFALEPGRQIGTLLEEVREAQASGEVKTKEQALELVRASIERGGNGA